MVTATTLTGKALKIEKMPVTELIKACTGWCCVGLQTLHTNKKSIHEVFISPNGECILNTSQTISNGAKLTIAKNKKITITGELNRH